MGRRTVAKRKRDIVERYLKVRIDSLCEERTKNDNEVAHMVIDKAVGELSYVLELLQKDEKNKS